MNSECPIRIGIVAGEASGDRLGAGLIRAVQTRCPHAQFVGVGGSRMVAAGLDAWYPLEHLAVMGLVEVLGHLPRLLRLRRELARRFLAADVDLFIGVDAPDFNLGLARRLKARGMPTLHYVSPTVWAWRSGRTQTVAQSVDAVLALFPFEAEYYRDVDMGVHFVGHPMADEIPESPDRTGARRDLGIPDGAELVALLPGSRVGEIQRLAPDFLRAAALCLERRPQLRFVAPMAGPAAREVFEAARKEVGATLPLQVTDGGARRALAAADAALVASGTATLEAALLQCPFVVAYRVAPLSYHLFRRLIRTEQIALPNLLAGEAVVPEFIQAAVQPAALADALLRYLEAPEMTAEVALRFKALGQTLRQNADERAADVVLEHLAAAPSPDRRS